MSLNFHLSRKHFRNTPNTSSILKQTLLILQIITSFKTQPSSLFIMYFSALTGKLHSCLTPNHSPHCYCVLRITAPSLLAIFMASLVAASPTPVEEGSLVVPRNSIQCLNINHVRTIVCATICKCNEGGRLDCIADPIYAGLGCLKGCTCPM